MPSCVSEGSYNAIFGMAIGVILLLAFFAAYNWDKYSKADDKTLTPDDSTTGKHISQGMLIAAILILGGALFMYFGNTTRLVGVYTNVPGQ